MTVPPWVQLRLIVGTLIASVVLASILAEERWSHARAFALIVAFLPLVYWFFRALPVDRAKLYSHQAVFGVDKIAPEPAALGRVWFDERTGFVTPTTHSREKFRAFAKALRPVSGARFHVPYVLDRSPDGMYSFLGRLVGDRFNQVPLQTQLRYLRLLGCDSILTLVPLQHPQIELQRVLALGEDRLHWYRVRGALSKVTLIRRVTTFRFIQQAVARIESAGFEEGMEATAPMSAVGIPTGPGRILSIEAGANELRIDVVSESGSTLLVNESYFRAWRATIEGRELSILPLNIDRLGVIVPPGRHTLQLSFGRRRLLILSSWTLSTLLLVAALITSIRK